MSKPRLFVLSVLLTMAVLLVDIYLHRPGRYAPKLIRVAGNVFITSQLAPENLPALRYQRIHTLVDIRPDGESRDQTPSTEIASASVRNRLDFHYIPVPHENIPDDAVAALDGVLAQGPYRTVLYCRSGRRAVRTFALARASQPDGPSADAILAMAHTAGFSADDLRVDIARRISQRPNPLTFKTDEHPNPSP